MNGNIDAPSFAPGVAITCALFVFLAAAGGRPQPVAAQDRDREELAIELIEQLLEDQVTAWNQGDIDAFMETYWNSESLTFSSGGQTTRGWQATLDRYRTRYATRERMGRLEFSGLETSLLGTDAALVLGQWKLTRADETLDGNFSLVLRTVEGRWKIVHDHTSLRRDE